MDYLENLDFLDSQPPPMGVSCLSKKQPKSSLRYLRARLKLVALLNRQWLLEIQASLDRLNREKQLRCQLQQARYLDNLQLKEVLACLEKLRLQLKNKSL